MGIVENLFYSEQEPVAPMTYPPGVYDRFDYRLWCFARGQNESVGENMAAFLNAARPFMDLGSRREPLSLRIGSGKDRPLDDKRWAKTLERATSKKGLKSVTIGTVAAGKEWGSLSVTFMFLDTANNGPFATPHIDIDTIPELTEHLDATGWSDLLDDAASGCSDAVCSDVAWFWNRRYFDASGSVYDRHLGRFIDRVGWALWLGGDLVGHLGGVDRVLADAPVYSARPIGSGVVLQSTALPWDAGREELTPLAEFLAPILPASWDDLDAYDAEIDWVSPYDRAIAAGLSPAAAYLVSSEGMDYDAARAAALDSSEQWSSPEGWPEQRISADWLGDTLDLDVPFGVSMAGEVSPAVKRTLQDAIEDWSADMDLDGVYGENEPAVGYLSFIADLGTRTDLETAVAELARRLSWFSANVAPIEALRLGEGHEPNPFDED